MPISSYLIPIDDMTIEERVRRRTVAAENLMDQARQLAIRQQGADFVVRDILPGTDLGLAASEDWLVAGAGVGGTELQYIASAVAQDRVIVLYGLALLSSPQGVSRIRFTQGTASTAVRMVVQVEKLEYELRPAGYLTEDINWVRNETVRIMVMPRTGGFAANSQRVILLGLFLEPVDNILSARSAV